MFRSKAPAGDVEAAPAEKVASTSILAQNVQFDGTLTGGGLVRLEGAYAGFIRNDGHLVIGPEAVVKATIEGRDVTIFGQAEGEVSASGRLELKATARLAGAVHAKRLVVAEGAQVRATCDVRPAEGAARRTAEDAMSGAAVLQEIGR